MCNRKRTNLKPKKMTRQELDRPRIMMMIVFMNLVATAASVMHDIISRLDNTGNIV